MGHDKRHAHQRGQRLGIRHDAAEGAAPTRPTNGTKLVTLAALIAQYDEARADVKLVTKPDAVIQAEKTATQAYRAVVTHFIDQISLDKSLFTHHETPPKDCRAVCLAIGADFKSLITSKQPGALVTSAAQEDSISKIKAWLSRHPQAPKASGAEYHR